MGGARFKPRSSLLIQPFGGFCSFLRNSCKYGLGSLRKTPMVGTHLQAQVPQADNWPSTYNQPITNCICFHINICSQSHFITISNLFPTKIFYYVYYIILCIVLYIHIFQCLTFPFIIALNGSYFQLPGSHRTQTTRFRWIQPPGFKSSQAWAIGHLYIGEECKNMCSGHGKCSSGICKLVIYCS